MRKTVPFLLAVLFAVPAFGQTLDQPSRLSVFITNPGAGWSEGGGSFFDAGYGVAFERRFTRAWSAEVAASIERYETQPYLFDDTTFDLQTYPVDLVARYSFASVHTRWRPYIGAGVRYVAAPDEPPGEVYEDLLSPQITGGVEFNAAERWSVRFDLKQLIRDDTPVYEEWFKVSIGAGLRF